MPFHFGLGLGEPEETQEERILRSLVEQQAAPEAAAGPSNEELLALIAESDSGGGLTSKQEIASIITQLLPVGIAALSGGGSERLGQAAGAGKEAGKAQLEEFEKESAAERKFKRSLGLLGVKGNLSERAATKKRTEAAETFTSRLGERSAASLKLAKDKKVAGVGAGQNIKIQLPLAEKGPPLTDVEMEVLTGKSEAVRFQAQKLKAATGQNLNTATLDRLNKTYALSPKQEDEKSEQLQLIDAVGAMKVDFAGLEDRNAFIRWIVSNTPAFIPIGEDEKIFDAGLKAFALRLSAILNKGRPSEKDAQAVLNTLPKVGATKKLGRALIERLDATLRLGVDRNRAARGERDPLTEEELTEFRAGLVSMGANVALKALEGPGSPKESPKIPEEQKAAIRKKLGLK